MSTHLSGPLLINGVDLTSSQTIANLSVGATPDKLATSATITPAAGSANVSLVTIQLKDGSGANMARVVPINVWLSDSAAGLGLTATTASGAVAVGASGTDLTDLTAKKHKTVLTDATGKYILSITDTAKTGFYVACTLPTGKVAVSSQLVTGNYG